MNWSIELTINTHTHTNILRALNDDNIYCLIMDRLKYWMNIKNVIFNVIIIYDILSILMIINCKCLIEI